MAIKKLSDYKNDEAIELWADLLEPIGRIVQDEAIKTVMKSGKAPIVIAQEVLKNHSKDAAEILLRIDSTPLNGMNIVTRLVALITEIGTNKEMIGFFGFAGTQTDSASSGSATENTGDAKK